MKIDICSSVAGSTTDVEGRDADANGHFEVRFGSLGSMFGKVEAAADFDQLDRQASKSCGFQEARNETLLQFRAIIERFRGCLIQIGLGIVAAKDKINLSIEAVVTTGALA